MFSGRIFDLLSGCYPDADADVSDERAQVMHRAVIQVCVDSGVAGEPRPTGNLPGGVDLHSESVPAKVHDVEKGADCSG